MSEQPMINNLVLNGTFARHGTSWTATATAPGRVDFSRQHCIITATGRAEQEVPASGGTSYTFSAYTLITHEGAGSARLTFRPSDTSESIGLTGNHGWTHRSITFNTPAGTTGITVQLIGDAGDVWFDNVRLVEDEGTVIPIELIRNGDFAENRKDWSITEIPPGSVSIHDNRCQATLGGFIEQVITVTPGQTYDFSIEAMTPSGGHGFAIFELTPDSVQQIELRGGGGWDTYTHSLTIPEGIPEFTLRILGETSLVVDNLSLKLFTASANTPN